MGGFRAFSRGIAFIRTIILARILSPAQFGVYGIALLILAFLETFTETGINIFLIQEKEKIDDYVDTAWIVSIARGLIIAFITLITIPLTVHFFNSPEVVPLLYLVALVSAIRGFINPSRVAYQKDLEFGKEFWFRSSIFFVDSAVAIIISVLTHSAIGLVWGLVAGGVLEVALSHILLSPKPKLFFDKEKLRKIVGRGKWVTSAGIFDYLSSQGDDAVVGRILDTTALGIYQMAYRISTLPITEVTDVAGKVVFPIYVKITEDKKRLRRAFVKSIAAVTALVVPVGAILYAFPEPLVRLVLGEKWIAVVPILKVLAIFGVVKAMSGTSGALFFSLKKQQYVATTTFVRFVVLAIGIVPLTIKYGVVGAAYASLASSLVALPVVYYLAWKVLADENN